MAAALLSLLGVLLSAYLYLYKIGVIGTLVCGNGQCETVQWSRWSRFLGVDVALLGLGGYLALLLVSLAGLQPGQAERRWPDTVVRILAGGGVLFSAWLTYVELFVIHAICRWCVGSAVLITAIFISAIWGRSAPRASPTPGLDS